jgi:hypothetical protein
MTYITTTRILSQERNVGGISKVYLVKNSDKRSQDNLVNGISGSIVKAGNTIVGLLSTFNDYSLINKENSDNGYFVYNKVEKIWEEVEIENDEKSLTGEYYYFEGY